MKKLQKFALALAFAGATVGCGVTYSDGYRVGTVTKLSHKGIACKTWEGELAMDNFSSVRVGKYGSAMSNTFAFSVTDEKVVKQIQDAQESGQRVKLHYDQVLIKNPCTSDTDYYITSVTPAAKTAPTQAPGR